MTAGVNQRIGQVYAGGYVDGRQGAVLLAGDHIAHLTVEQCRTLAPLLTQLADLIAEARLTAAECRRLAALLAELAEQP